jgi:hypothetical protein
MTKRFNLLAVVLLAAYGCREALIRDESHPRQTVRGATMHPKVDFGHWAKIFPVETFEKKSGPRQFNTTPAGDPLDLWKPGGTPITSPADLCHVELVRQSYARTKNLGRAVPVDIIMWSVAPPVKSFLTKLGGVPHRESSKAWPTSDGMPYTFVGQFCFVDSRDIVSRNVPGDVMLIFFRDAGSIFDPSSVHIEWSSCDLDSPLTAEKCPKPSFVVPRLSGHIYRTNEYPDSWDVFEQAGHDQCYLFPTTQSSKIGRETRFVQGDPRRQNQELLCALNSVYPDTYTTDAKWPFIGLETLPEGWDKPDEHSGWGQYKMMFGDTGCMYFMIDGQGQVTWTWDCY